MSKAKQTLVTVNGIKETLEKEVGKGDDMSLETCKDLLEQLDKCTMTLGVLTRSLIGTVVSKLKKHDELGPKVKELVKKWKKVAKEGEEKKKVKAERRASDKSTGSATKEEPLLVFAEEWEDLDPSQKAMCQKLHKFMSTHKPQLIKSGINEEAVNHLLVSRSTEIEAAMTEKFKRDKAGYTEKARTLCFNLKKNPQLAEQVITGAVAPAELLDMTSEQMASAEARKAREEAAHKLVDGKRLDWEQANEDKINEMCGIKGDLLKASLFTCGRCKSAKTTSTQKQTRSADEPMTVFVFCMNCGNRWKC